MAGVTGAFNFGGSALTIEESFKNLQINRFFRFDKKIFDVNHT